MKTQTEVIGYMLTKDEMIVANPCTIPLELIKEQLEALDKDKPKKDEVKIVSLIAFPNISAFGSRRKKR